MYLHHKYKQIHVSPKLALRHKIDVPDDACICHTLMFRHRTIWPNHSKQILVLYIYLSDDYTCLYMIRNMSASSLYIFNRNPP